MVGMPGFLARFLTRVFGQGFGISKYSVQFYRDRRIQFYSSIGSEEGTEKPRFKTSYSLSNLVEKNLVLTF